MQKILLVVVAILCASLAGSLVFIKTKENILLGSWSSTDSVYGVREHLVFTEFGLYEQGSHIPADYQISHQEIVVTTERSSIEYIIMTEDKIKKRVPRSKWRFYTRDGSKAARERLEKDSEISRY